MSEDPWEEYYEEYDKIVKEKKTTHEMGFMKYMESIDSKSYEEARERIYELIAGLTPEQLQELTTKVKNE